MPFISVIIPEYRDPFRAIALACALATQRLDRSDTLEIIIVDDDSQDESPDVMASELGTLASIIRTPRNMGRGGACNLGAQIAKGDILMFIDSDCLPGHDALLANHLQSWTPSTVASVGDVEGSGTGFWHRFQVESSARRKALHATGKRYAASSVNMMVMRRVFMHAGGFSHEYTSYGFEDRDLQIRIGTYGTVTWADDAAMRHIDTLTMAAISRKMLAAGEITSSVFSVRHPAEYRALGYARIDTRQHARLRLPAALTRMVIGPFCMLTDSIVRTGGIPYPIKRTAVRLASAMSYMVGTENARRTGTSRTHQTADRS